MLISCLLQLHLLVAPAAFQNGTAGHDRAFWLAIVQGKYEVPAGEDPFKLLTEMNTLVGSTDPVLRDDVAYSSAARWIYRKRLLTAPQQKALLTTWLDNLSAGIGERETDSVFRRSFSALNLSILAALDNDASFLSQAEFDDFLGRTLTYLEQERDVRGFDPVKGWIHTPAHTADVLKVLARSPKLSPQGQARILQALSGKCERVGHGFTWGEDERLAQAVRSIARRADLDAAGLDAWLAQFPVKYRQLWANGPAIDPALFPGVHNDVLLLRAAFTALSADKELSPAAEHARQQLLVTLSAMQ
jgi:hypothetical protein